MQNRVPTGTVTFLFTDIEGSTRMWESHPKEMERAFKMHEYILRGAIEDHNGYAYKMIGDAFQAAFQTAPDAAAAAVSAQRALHDATWPPNCVVRVRMALHTGETEERGDDYVGPLLNRAARLMAAGHGGQVLLSGAAHALLADDLSPGIRIRYLGEKRLKDLVRPERIYQLTGPGLPDEFPPLRTLDRFRQNLPVQNTEFIGRKEELDEVQQALLSAPLVTLRGSGGIGKSRLSLQAAADLLDAFPDGVWFVELASVVEGGSLLKTVLNAIGLREDPSRAPLQTLKDFFSRKRSLVILDNCEHLILPVAALVEDLVLACPQLTLLATSREALDVGSERVIDLASLSLPDEAGETSGEALLNSDSATLFIARAQTVLPGFAVTDENAAAFAALIRRLDGIPLAIELAAARVGMLSVEQIERRLSESLGLLKTRSRSVLPHQQTMQALLDWSFNLLSESEQRLFLQLSVFNGGWTLQAAESVCQVDGVETVEILDLLAQLAGKSLIVVIRIQGEETRYRMLEPIRQYAAGKLAKTSGLRAVFDRHQRFFLALIEIADSHFRSADQKEWVPKIEADHNNIVTALEHSISRKTDPGLGLRMAARMGLFWYVRGYLAEGQAWLERFTSAGDFHRSRKDLALGYGALSLLNAAQGNLVDAQEQITKSIRLHAGRERSEDAITACIVAGVIGYFRRNEPAETRRILEDCLQRSRATGFEWGAAEALHMLGHVAGLEKNLPAARACFEEAVQILRALGDDYSLSHPLNDLGRAAQHAGDLKAAREIAEESLALSTRLDFSWGRALALVDLGKIALGQADLESAGEHLAASLQTAADVGDKLRIIESLTFLGFLACERREKESFAKLLGAVEALREKLAYPLSPSEQAELNRYIERHQDLFGEPVDRVFWDRGREMPMDQAIQLGLSLSL